MPATISKSFVQTKDAALKDEYDEWLARIICYAFAVAPGSLTRDNNRATADFQHSQALQEGLLPLMRWVKALVDRSIADHFGWPDLEFAWKQDRDIDPLTQAQINQIYLAAGVLTPDEVRAEIGEGDAAAKRQAGGVVAKDWRTQGRQGEGAKNPAWFGNGTGGRGHPGRRRAPFRRWRRSCSAASGDASVHSGGKSKGARVSSGSTEAGANRPL